MKQATLLTNQTSNSLGSEINDSDPIDLGPTATALFINGKSDDLIEQLSQMNPIERLGAPQDIADTVSFLARPRGGWVNGQTLRANGGMV